MQNKSTIIEIIKSHIPSPIGVEKHYSIGIPLIEIDGDYYVLFEKRAQTLNGQPGEICFPGGAVEPQESYLDAAIRETHEELGLPLTHISFLGPMDYIITPYNAIIHAYVLELNVGSLNELSLNDHEVSLCFTVPLNYLINAKPKSYSIKQHYSFDSDFPFHKIPQGENYPWRLKSPNILFYEYEEHVIWGLTAKILEAFLGHLTKNQTDHTL